MGSKDEAAAEPQGTGPPVRWMGFDLRGQASDEHPGIAEFTRTTPPGSGENAHYELLAVAARGFRPPRFITTAEEVEGAAGDEEHFEALRPTWSLRYRPVAEIGSSAVTPFAIYLLGVNPPADASAEDLDAFNHFYTTVHLPEVAERRHALRAVRYELIDEVRAPYQGAPRFLAVYAVDEEGAAHRRHTGPSYRAGPDVWQRHKTPWRLWYRRLVAPVSLDRAT